jgi:small subunit ribosomal protein S12
MARINQLTRFKKRKTKKINLNKTPALYKNPQKYGTCTSVFTKTPRKPNSALRKVAKVKLVNSNIISTYIPGEGHNISRFSDVLVHGRRIRDLPGVKYGLVRGKLDLDSLSKRRNGRSKYGTKSPSKPSIIKDRQTAGSSDKSYLSKKVRQKNKMVKNQIKNLFLKKPLSFTDHISSWFRLQEKTLNKLTYIHLKNKLSSRLDRKNFIIEKLESEGRQFISKRYHKKTPVNIRKAWLETRMIVSYIKRNISKEENDRYMDNHNKSKRTISSPKHLEKGRSIKFSRFQGNFYVLEVSMRYRFIRVEETRTHKIYRFSFNKPEFL